MRRLLSALTVALCLLLAGCGFNPIGGLLVTKSAKEKEIAALKVEHDAKLATATATQEAAARKVIASKDAQMVGAAASLYGADAVFRTVLTPTRTDLLTNNLVNEAWTALGRPAPTVVAMQAMNDRLKRELDEAQTSLADLQRSHQAAMTENAALAERTKRHAAELAAAEEAKVALTAAFQRDLAVKQGELIDVQAKLVAAEKARSDDAAARQAQLAKLSWGAGILAALCLAGAIWSPIGKRELALGAAVLAGAAVAIPFIEGWMILTAVGVALAAITSWALLKHRKDERLSDSLALAFEDAKDHASDAYAKIAPFVEDRLKRYVKRDGKLVPETDRALQQHLEAKLADYDALGAVPTQQP